MMTESLANMPVVGSPHFPETVSLMGVMLIAPLTSHGAVPAFHSGMSKADGVLVRTNIVVNAPAVAVTLYVPGLPLAMAVVEAKPAASVTAENAESVAPAPVEGAAKVTVTPGTGLASKSRTITRKGEPNCTPFTAVCSVPVETAIVAGGPAVCVREKRSEERRVGKECA